MDTDMNKFCTTCGRLSACTVCCRSHLSQLYDKKKHCGNCGHFTSDGPCQECEPKFYKKFQKMVLAKDSEDTMHIIILVIVIAVFLGLFFGFIFSIPYPPMIDIIVNPQAKSETKDEAQSEIKDEAQSEPKDEAQSEIKDEAQSEIKDEAQSETKDEAKSETKDEAKSETKDEANSRPKMCTLGWGRECMVGEKKNTVLCNHLNIGLNSLGFCCIDMTCPYGFTVEDVDICDHFGIDLERNNICCIPPPGV